MKNRNQIPPAGGSPPLDMEKIRHDVSTAVGLIDTAYEELKENPKSDLADRYFELGVTRLRDLIHQLDEITK